MPQKGRTPPPGRPPLLERRIQACLKACEGISTEALESGNLKLVLDQLTSLHTALRALEQSAGEVCDQPDGVTQLQTALGSLERGVGTMCDGAGRPRGQVSDEGV